MVSSKRLNRISNWVYSADKGLKRKKNYPRPIKNHDYFIDKHKYYVIDVKDNNKNGFQGMAVAPYKHGKVDYSQTTIAYAGTGDANKGAYNSTGIGKDAMDVEQDWEAFNDGRRNHITVYDKNHNEVKVDSQFVSAIEFYRNVQKEVLKNHPNAKFVVTGHSLGGGIALLIASHFQVSAKVFSAPDPWKVMTSEERMWSLTHPELLMNYRHHNDAASQWDSKFERVDGFTGTTIWAKSSKEGSPIGTHDLGTFEFTDGGKVKIIGDMDQDLRLLDERLGALKAMTSELKKSDGKLTSSEKIFLDAAEAVSISDSLSRIAADGIDKIISNYNKGIANFSDIWKKTVKSAEAMADDLTYYEVMDALEAGGVTHKTVVEDPTAEFEERIAKANKVKQEYSDLTQKIKNQVDKMISTDKELAGIFK